MLDDDCGMSCLIRMGDGASIDVVRMSVRACGIICFCGTHVLVVVAVVLFVVVVVAFGAVDGTLMDLCTGEVLPSIAHLSPN